MSKTERPERQDLGKTISISAPDLAAASRLLRRITEHQEAQGVADCARLGREPAVANCSVNEELQYAHLAKIMFHNRALRRRYFPASLFGEPAWDMLLGLLISAADKRIETVSGLAHLVGHPLSTSLRWLDYLEQSKYIERQPHPTDKRVITVVLTKAGLDKLANFFEDVVSAQVASKTG